MKTLICIALLLISTSAFAANFITQAVFSISSSAVSGTPNLRVVPMTPKQLARTPDNTDVMQNFQWQANKTVNYYLTKSQTVDLSLALCLWVQVDQATFIKVNSESAYMILPSGYNNSLCFK